MKNFEMPSLSIRGGLLTLTQFNQKLMSNQNFIILEDWNRAW